MCASFRCGARIATAVTNFHSEKVGGAVYDTDEFSVFRPSPTVEALEGEGDHPRSVFNGEGTYSHTVFFVFVHESTKGKRGSIYNL